MMKMMITTMAMTMTMTTTTTTHNQIYSLQAHTPPSIVGGLGFGCVAARAAAVLHEGLRLRAVRGDACDHARGRCHTHARKGKAWHARAHTLYSFQFMSALVCRVYHCPDFVSAR